MTNRFRFVEVEDGRVDVIGLDDQAICWLPGAAAAAIEGAYKRRWLQDMAVANEWMDGVLFGVHHSIAFGNQVPVLEHIVVDGLSVYRMRDPSDEV